MRKSDVIGASWIGLGALIGYIAMWTTYNVGSFENKVPIVIMLYVVALMSMAIGAEKLGI